MLNVSGIGSESHFYPIFIPAVHTVCANNSTSKPQIIFRATLRRFHSRVVRFYFVASRPKNVFISTPKVHLLGAGAVHTAIETDTEYHHRGRHFSWGRQKIALVQATKQ